MSSVVSLCMFATVAVEIEVCHQTTDNPNYVNSDAAVKLKPLKAPHFLARKKTPTLVILRMIKNTEMMYFQYPCEKYLSGKQAASQTEEKLSRKTCI